MSKSKHWYIEDATGKSSLAMWVSAQMGLGALYAAVAFFGVIGLILLIRAVSYILPEDPYAAIEPLRAAVTLIA